MLNMRNAEAGIKQTSNRGEKIGTIKKVGGYPNMM
jgi:hypothetical protein